MARKKITGIYRITSPSNKVYIGQSIDINRRLWSYRALKCEKQIKIYRSLKKYGVDKHKFEILCECAKEQLNDLEIYYMDLYQSFTSKFGLNSTSGGRVNYKLSDETRMKISLKSKGNKNMLGKKHSLESKIKMSNAQKGKKVSEEERLRLASLWKGKKLSAESIYKRTQTRILNGSNKHTDETKAKLRNITEANRLAIIARNTGRKLSEETKKKIGLAFKGKKPWMAGRSHTEETKKKLAEYESIMVINLQNGIFYDSIKEGAASFGINANNLSKKLSGFLKVNNTPFAYANN